MHSVFVVSEVAIYREGVASFLARQPGLEVAGSSAHVDHSIGRYDLCVLDVSGLDPPLVSLFLATMRQVGTAVVVIGLPGTQERVVACLEAGASGYVTADESLEELYRVIRRTMSSGVCVRERDIAALLSRLRMRQGEDAVTAANAVPLTDREREVARLLARNRTNQEIARELGISVHTVKHHVHSTLIKLGMERRGEAAALSVAADMLVDGSGAIDRAHGQKRVTGPYG